MLRPIRSYLNACAFQERGALLLYLLTPPQVLSSFASTLYLEKNMKSRQVIHSVGSSHNKKSSPFKCKISGQFYLPNIWGKTSKQQSNKAL